MSLELLSFFLIRFQANSNTAGDNAAFSRFALWLKSFGKTAHRLQDEYIPVVRLALPRRFEMFIEINRIKLLGIAVAHFKNDWTG